MDYRETVTEGITREWRRCWELKALNLLDRPPVVQFAEEDVRRYPDGRTAVVNNTACEVTYDPSATFPLLNPADGSPLSPGLCAAIFSSILEGSANHVQMYVINYSLYMATATVRDNPPQEASGETVFLEPADNP
jgi:hypothetical protein